MIRVQGKFEAFPMQSKGIGYKKKSQSVDR